jgi:hypothetical protein
MRNRFWGLAILALFLPAASLFGTVMESYNAGQPQAVNTFWGVTDIGWYYTPMSSYSLDGMATVFTQSTDPGDVNRVVTFAIFTDRPANGGTLMASGTFNTSTARGVYGGALFAPVALTLGTTYFVALENVSHLGVDEVSFSTGGGNAGPPGSVALGSTWQDNGGAGFGTQGSNGTTWFDKPVIEFLAPAVGGAPEPGTWVLMAIPAALLYLRLRKRTA